MNDNTDQNTESQNDDSRTALEGIRDRALGALGPIAESLQETPERKFDILMTAARLGEPNTELLDKALQAAMSMEDGTPKAQALIDVLNETTFRLDEQSRS